jgi:hypothetical protein
LKKNVEPKFGIGAYECLFYVLVMLVYAWEVNEKSDHSTPALCVNSSAFYLKMIVGACNTQGAPAFDL